MAIYHLSVKYVSRNQGRSPVAAAAYRAGEKLHNKYDGQTHDYTHKRGIVHTEILLPENAPPEFANRETLWNSVEFAEKRKDARTAREIEVALPNELSKEEQIKLVREYAQENFISHGMCADIAIHDGKHGHRKDEKHIEAEHDGEIAPDNPHAHILLTARPLAEYGFLQKKDRAWEKPENVRNWRKNWATTQNKEFERKGLDVRVSHESHADRGIDREPTKHMGHTAHSMEKRGIRTERGNENRTIKARNKIKDELEQKRLLEQEQSQQRSRGREQQRFENQLKNNVQNQDETIILSHRGENYMLEAALRNRAMQVKTKNGTENEKMFELQPREGEAKKLLKSQKEREARQNQLRLEHEKRRAEREILRKAEVEQSLSKDNDSPTRIP